MRATNAEDVANYTPPVTFFPFAKQFTNALG